MAAVRRGLTYERAARAGGISVQTFHSWRRRAEAELERVARNPRAQIRQSEWPFVDFFEQLEEANVEAEILLANYVANAAKTEWRAAAFILKTRFSRDWGDNAELWKELLALKEQVERRG